MGTVKRPPMTAERFLRLGSTHGYELVNGRPKEKAMGWKASWVQNRLGGRLDRYAEENQLGFVAGSEGLYQCFPHAPDQVRKPDVSYIRRGRLPGDALPDTACRIPPDLIAEVISPNEKVSDLNAKLKDFRRVGVPLMWVIDPGNRSITVYRDGKVTDELTDTDDLTGDPVLPGFRVRVSDLFPPAPPAS